VKRVVAATLDPNPRVNGKGMRQLRGAGIAVDVGLLREKARRLNEAYFTFMRELRPFVTLKLAATLDGMIADDKGESQWITGAEARRYVQWLRLGADVVVVGAGTVLADNPRLTCRGRGRRATARAVLDSELVTPVRARLFSEPGAVIIFTSSTSVQRARSLEKAGAEVVRVRGAGLRLPWPRVLAEFYQRQFMSVLVEGGAEVASSALDAGVVDKLCVIHAPKLLGPGLSFSRSMRPRPLALALGLRNVTHTCMGDDMLTEGYVHRAG
jgi:diaminohydroxyphosphoribosylaminopyrimidine deaminase/5-amino-6-(5-phosphoribosylamino)uracil reductase